MKVLKRNQIIISVLALMLITVGYMSYTSNISNTVETGAMMDSETMAAIGDAKLVNSSDVVENKSDISQANSSEVTENVDNKTEDNSEGSLVENDSVKADGTSETKEKSEPTSAITYTADYFVSSRLERDKMYSQMLETYQTLAKDSNISPEQKNVSTQEISNINNQKNSIMIAENLIKNLGFEDAIIFVNANSTSVIVKADKLSDADVAQIQNIVCREIGVDAECIHISLK